MDEAIRLAIENGWIPAGLEKSFLYFNPSQKTRAVIKWKFKQRIICDPLFWQALSKALEWNQNIYQAWLYYAKKYFHLVITGKDTKNFWKELLNPQTNEYQ